MLLLHSRLAVAVLLYMLILGVWGLVGALRRTPGIAPSYRGSLVIGELLAVVQVLLGGGLLLAGHRSPEGLHYLYGLLVPLILPFLYGAVRGQPGRRAALLYGIASLFVFALALRAIATG